MKSLPIVFGRQVGDVLEPLQAPLDGRTYAGHARSVEQAIAASIKGDAVVSNITVGGAPLMADGQVVTVVGGRATVTPTALLPGGQGWRLDRVPSLHDGPIVAGVDIASDRIEVDIAMQGMSLPLYLSPEEWAALDGAARPPSSPSNRRARRAAAAARRRGR